MAQRTAEINRPTAETAVTGSINVDGTGPYSVTTGMQMLDHMATGEDQEDRLVAFHFTSWLKGGLETEKLG